MLRTIPAIEATAREALRLGGHKLPCKVKIVKKQEETLVEGGAV